VHQESGQVEYQLEQEKKVTVEVFEPGSVSKKPIVEVKVQEIKIEKKTPISEIKDYLKKNTKFDGTPKSFHTLIKDKSHKNFFNNVCETYGLDKVSVIKQILK
jgi:hypothetical protein